MKKILKLIRNFANKLLGPLLFRTGRIAVANTYIKGNGLEIGALHSPLPVTIKAKVKYVDRMNVADLRKHYPELRKLNLVPVDIIDDGERLGTIADSTKDFVIANHFLEHCENPILAIVNMYRVLKPNGVIYLAIPDKRFTFDADRQVTDIEHLMHDYQDGPENSRRAHFEEWVRLVSKVNNPAVFLEETEKLINMNYSIHYHVWSSRDILELVLHLQHMLSFEIELFLRNKAENILVVRKI